AESAEAPETPPRNVRSKGQAPPAGGNASPAARAATTAERRRRVAAFLAEHGPTTANGIAGRPGLTVPAVYRLIDYPWFTKEGGKVHLQNEGRAAVSGAAGEEDDGEAE